jgi:hypothetical protein
MPVEIVAVPARASGHPHLAERTTDNVDVAEVSAERVAERPVERRADGRVLNCHLAAGASPS